MRSRNPALPPVTTPIDTTALDVLDRNAYPDTTPPTAAPVAVHYPPSPAPANWPYLLAPGSDLKIVGGDNMTLTANDARSQTRGHAYGLVQAGQTSVVYSSDKFQGAIDWQYGDAQTQLTHDQAAAQTAQDALDQAKADQQALQEFWARSPRRRRPRTRKARPGRRTPVPTCSATYRASDRSSPRLRPTRPTT